MGTRTLTVLGTGSKLYEDDARLMRNMITADEFQARRAKGNCFRCNVECTPDHQCLGVDADILNEIEIPVPDEALKRTVRLVEKGINDPPQEYFLSETAILGIVTPSFVLMATDTLSTRGGKAFNWKKEKLVDLGIDIVSAGSGNTLVIDVGFGAILAKSNREKIAAATSLRDVAHICADALNKEMGFLKLERTSKDYNTAFMVVGIVKETRNIFLIRLDDDSTFVVQEACTNRSYFLGTGFKRYMAYLEDHPILESWSVQDAINYCIAFLPTLFVSDPPTSGGAIRIRVIFGNGKEVDDYTYTKQIEDGVSGYFLMGHPEWLASDD